MRICRVDGCGRDARCRELCDRHYRRWLRWGDPLFVAAPSRLSKTTLSERLAESRDESAGPDSCWPWRGLLLGGYGVVYDPVARRQIRAHRAAYQEAKGEIPAGLEVLHSCDNPPCCNPAHLSVGTHAENMRQMSERRRASAGKANPRTKLSDDDLAEIARLSQEGLTNIQIAKRFGVGQPHVSRILNGRRRPDAGTPAISTDRRRRKLTNAQVVELRTLFGNGVTATELAERYGLNPVYALHVAKGIKR